MRHRFIALIIGFAAAGTAPPDIIAGSPAAIEAEKIYMVYGRQQGDADFTEYNAILCYYKPENSQAMTLIIEPSDKATPALSFAIAPDGWATVTDDGMEGDMYQGTDFKIVVFAVDEEDGLLIVSRPKQKPTTYLFDIKPANTE